MPPAKDGPREQRVEHEVDAFAVRRATSDFARELGFGRIACIELAIAASELTSNIVKYGVRGRVRLEAIDDPARGVGIRVTALDEGPPFNDFSMAIRDGCDDRGPVDPMTLIGRRGIGSGLGAVKRFSDELGWEPTPGGKQVWLVRYLAHGKKRPGSDR
jgi:anti-sigma regulatory factor (Ser/Thr protein kinase)